MVHRRSAIGLEGKKMRSYNIYVQYTLGVYGMFEQT